MISIRDALGPKPDREAEILLCHSLKKNRAYLFAHPQELLSHNQWEQYQNLLAQRAQGFPIAYLTGEREFWSINLKVTQDTLIPRHETELLVELALKHIPAQTNIFILELGTGSGAIALALAKERPQWQINACDISKKALKVAKENAKNHKINNVRFYHSDWFSKIPQGQYHAVLSNPPYLAKQDPHLQEADLRFEPHIALVSSQEGFADLQYIAQKAYSYLLPNACILLEHGYDQKLKTGTLLRELGYKNIECWKDLQGHDRVSGGWR